MATQQHYLVEINEKLQGVQKGVDEVLARMDEEKSGTLAYVCRTTLDSRERLAEGRALSAARVDELRDASQDAETVWHEFHLRVTRHLAEYRAGSRPARDVEQSWAMLLYATQVPGECSAVVTTLPFSTVGELEDATAEERERVMGAVESVRGLARELVAAHNVRGLEQREWNRLKTRNPARKAVRKVRRRTPVKPAHTPLDLPVAKHAALLGAPVKTPPALLVTVNENGSVKISAEVEPG